MTETDNPHVRQTSRIFSLRLLPLITNLYEIIFVKKEKHLFLYLTTTRLQYHDIVFVVRMPAEGGEDRSEADAGQGHLAECDWDCGFVGSSQEVEEHETRCPDMRDDTAWKEQTVTWSISRRTARIPLCSVIHATTLTDIQ